MDYEKQKRLAIRVDAHISIIKKSVCALREIYCEEECPTFSVMAITVNTHHDAELQHVGSTAMTVGIMKMNFRNLIRRAVAMNEKIRFTKGLNAARRLDKENES